MRSWVVYRTILAGALLGCAAAVGAQERWVSSIATSPVWASFPCKNYIITDVCSTDKDYRDPGLLPRVISVGDTVRYRAKDGKEKEFVVRHINFFVFDQDVDSTYAGQRLIARKGDTSCFLYSVRSRSKTRSTVYPSKIVVKGCQALR